MASKTLLFLIMCEIIENHSSAFERANCHALSHHPCAFLRPLNLQVSYLTLWLGTYLHRLPFISSLVLLSPRNFLHNPAGWNLGLSYIYRVDFQGFCAAGKIFRCEKCCIFGSGSGPLLFLDLSDDIKLLKKLMKSTIVNAVIQLTTCFTLHLLYFGSFAHYWVRLVKEKRTFLQFVTLQPHT